MEPTPWDLAVQSDDDPKDIPGGIEGLSKAVALCIAVLYVCGFLITSLHDFHFGFSEMNPLRPRILTAGAWFLLFLALPFALVRQLLRHKLWASESKWWFKGASLLLAYWFSCYLIFMAAGNIFVFDEQGLSTSPIPATWKIVLGGILIFISILAVVVFYSKIPKSLVALGIAVYFGIVLWQAIDILFVQYRFERSAPSLWMVAIGLICLYEMKLRSWKLKLGDWPQSLITFLAALLVFATSYYPHIKASWGGGMPIPINLTLTKDLANLPNQQISCLLIDETDSGFYVIGKNDKHATYVPRASVALIHFADASEISLFTPKGK
jgi:hypothetical protein